MFFLGFLYSKVSKFLFFFPHRYLCIPELIFATTGDWNGMTGALNNSAFLASSFSENLRQNFGFYFYATLGYNAILA